LYQKLPTWKRTSKHISMWFSLLKKWTNWCLIQRTSKNCTQNCPFEKGLASTFPCGLHYKKKGLIVAWCKGLSKDRYKELPTWKRTSKHISMWFSLLKKRPIVAWCKGLRIGTKNCPLEKGLGSTCPCGFHYQKRDRLFLDAKDYLRIV